MRLISCIAVCLGAAGLGSLLTQPALRPWYAGLAKPWWTPPNWLFGPVWTILYLAMAVAAWLVWRRSSLTAFPMQLFLLQLLLNVAWSAIFFHFRAPGWAFIEIATLWCAILLTTIAFGRSAPLPGWLMIPYLMWVTYAAALNFAIWRLNSWSCPIRAPRI
jgi:benzodiazapine receptor